MRVNWEVEDGYVGKSRPQETIVPDDELASCETEEEKQELIEDYVQADYDNNISWCIMGTEEE
jgi:hypothetical protein